MIILTAGEEITFDQKAEAVKRTEPENPNYLTWKTKVFSFKDRSLETVCNELESVYDVKFEFVNPTLKSCRLSVAFENQEIDAILKVLTATFDGITFTRDNKTIRIDGKSCN
jgi:transmembrane sensor